MAGISVEPTAAVVAEDDPEIVAKNIEANTDAEPRPPLNHPTSALASPIRRREIPPVCIRLPARMKNGTAIRENESSAS